MKKGGQFFHKLTLSDVPLAGKTVLVRADYNVPLEKDGTIADDFRVRSSVPTIKYLLEKNCKVVIISHLGRPEGREEKYSLGIVASRLEELLETSVQFVDNCIGDKARMSVKKAQKRSVTLLENLRYYKEEESNDEIFAAKIAKDSTAQYFVQDGFGVVHRAHASTDAITHYLPSVAGLLLEKEYNAIEGVMKQPDHPLVAVLGGAKVSDKIAVIEAIEPIADKILIGGAMANTFLAASGVKMGKSKYENDQTTEVKKIYSIATKKVGAGNEGDFLQLPNDVAVATDVNESAVRKNISIHNVANDEMALDIGDETIERYVKQIESARTVIWNGTLGLAEQPEFAHGSARIALALAVHPHVVSIIGGGDTADFALHWDSKNGASFTHVSTGGGASLELMSGEKLPGIESLLDARS